MCKSPTGRATMCVCCTALLLLAIGQGAIGIPLADFYPFGSAVGDSRLSSNDDGSSGAIRLNFTFPFFGTDYRMVYVNNNGVISFERSVRQFTSNPFPLVENPDLMLIAPYWADVDTRGTGTVWYRQTSNETLLLQARRAIRSAFVNQMTFQPTMLFIATWDHVGHYNQRTSLTNTFQCVMITDGRRSFVIFLYADGEIQWTTGDASGGRNGFGGTEAQVGFNAGDGIRFASVPGSQTAAIVNIDTTSNVGIPGVWIFCVDEQDIIVMRECSNDPTVAAVIGPRFGSQLGGTAVHITGPCFNETDQIACVFDNQPEQSGFYVNNLTVICVSPSFNAIGWKDLTLMVTRDGNLVYTARSRFYATNSGESTDITLDQGAMLLTAGNRITMRWDRESLLPLEEASSFTVDISLFRFNDETQTWTHFLDIAREQLNTGVAEFTVPSSNEVQSDIYPVSLRLSIYGILGPGRRSPVILVNQVAGLVRREILIYYGESFRFRQCTEWYLSEPADMGERLLSQVPNCCATEEGANLQNSDFERDDRLISTFHPEADTCFRQKRSTITSGSPGQQCCYKDGELLMGPDSGGTVDRYAPTGNVGDFLLHQYHDVRPYWYCCTGEFSMYTCGLYYERRPSSRGETCSRPPPACVYGDPHIVTLDGFKYTFNGLGEFVLIETSDNRFSLQGRMVQALDSDGNPISATVFSAIVGKERYSDTVQFQLADDDEVDVLVNGEFIDFDGLLEQQFNNVSVRTGENSATAVFSSGVYVEVRAANGILSTLLVSLADGYRSRTTGLMGNYNGDMSDDLLPRGANVPIPLTSSLRDIHNQFGVTWIIDSPADSLFTYASGQNWSTFYQPDFIPAFDPIFFSTSLEQQAEAICGDDQFCRFDIAATGRTDIGLTTLIGGLEFEMIANISQPVICSPPCEFGICVSNDTCSCADGYTGDTCADRISRDCEINPCENGGTCTLVATSYICSCQEGYTGLFCEQIEPGSGDDLLPVCTCTRDVECSLIGQLTNSQLTPITNQLKCTVQATPDPAIREKFVIDSTFNSQYLSPGSLTFLASIGALPRDDDFMSCVINGSPVQPFLDVLGAEAVSIIYTKSDGSFGSLDISMDSLQDIMSGGNDFTLGVALDEANLCSLQNLLQWFSSPQPTQISTCREPIGNNGITVAYFPVSCP